MDTCFVERPETELATVLRESASEEGVAGLLVVAATAEPLAPSVINPTLRDLSVPVFGGVFPEILFDGTRHTAGAVVVSLRETPTTTVISGISDPNTDIRAQLDTTVETPHETTAFVFVDGYASGIESFIQRLFERYGVECQFLGGGVGTLTDEQHPCLITNDGLLTDAAVVGTVPIPSSLSAKHGYRDVDGPFRANRTDGTTLSMLGDESAFQVYRQAVEADSGTELTRDNFFEVAKSYPFGISRLNDEKIVRDPFDVSANGSITCVGEIPEGEYLHVLNGDCDSLIEAARGATRDATASGPDGPLIAFDCISRALHLEPDFDAEIEAMGGPDQPAVGALTIGEIANGDGGRLQFYNNTAVVARVKRS